MSVAVRVAVSCRTEETVPVCSSVSTAVSSPVSVAVSRSAHHCAMIRLRSTHNDHPTSVSPRTTRHPATIEPARARHSLDDVARLASHGHFDRPPLCNCISTRASGTSSAAARRLPSSSGCAKARARDGARRSASSTRAARSDARGPRTNRRPRAGTLLQADSRQEGASSLTRRLSR